MNDEIGVGNIASKSDESTGLLIVKVLNEKCTRQETMFEVIVVIFLCEIRKDVPKEYVNDEIGVGNIASKSDESTGLLIVKVLNEKCTRQETMFEVIVVIFLCGLIFVELFHVKSILHANPLRTKNGMSIVQDRLSSRTSTQCKVSA